MNKYEPCKFQRCFFVDKSFNVFIMNALNLCVSGLYANGPEYVPAAGKRRDLPYFRFPKSSSGLLQESDLYCFLGPFRF